jgi:hypothetical protein
MAERITIKRCFFKFAKTLQQSHYVHSHFWLMELIVAADFQEKSCNPVFFQFDPHSIVPPFTIIELKNAGKTGTMEQDRRTPS